MMSTLYKYKIGDVLAHTGELRALRPGDRPNAYVVLALVDAGIAGRSYYCRGVNSDPSIQFVSTFLAEEELVPYPDLT